MRSLAAALLLLPLVLTGCSADEDGEVLTVLAASSLTEVFEELAAEFEAEHEGVELRFSFGSSTTLAEQAVQGAPGDVLATADELSMSLAEDGDALAGTPVALATNQLVLAVPHGNPARIRSLVDLRGTDWVRCADDVPCGRVALAVLDDAASGGTAVGEPASLEVDAKSVLAKVTSGEVDAGFVYATDAALARGDVTVVELPSGELAATTYFIAALDNARDEELAAEWVDLVTSERGQDALTDAGFTLP